MASVSARPYVQAATAAGYEVIALDAFADQDTNALAESVHAIPYINGSFDANALEKLLRQLAKQNPIGFVYGSGFEAQPAVLGIVEKYMPLIGNSERVVRNMKRAITFFALLDVLHIQHPAFRLQQLSKEDLNTAAWLIKRNGGSGGTHIRKVKGDERLEAGYYYQQELQGIPVSLLFIADGKSVREVGFNQQWLAPTSLMPYRYGGAVSQAEMPQKVKQQLLEAAQKLTSAVGLRGINSLDGIMAGEQLWILELNPRLTSTIDLYPSLSARLFDLHVQAVNGNLVDLPVSGLKAKAHYIVYAPENMTVPDVTSLPDWVADIPQPATRINAGEPICTVIAEGDSADEAVGLMAQRVKQLIKELI
ncbi:MAG: ATP-grasp domain-containing protein [Methylophilaceae bacterium]|nr:ATP-grasp domain-containing protein [Methylophilaceae bacterium]